MAHPPKVLLPEILGAQGALADELAARGFMVARAPQSQEPERMREVVADIDAIACHPRLRVPGELIEQAPRLRAVVSTVIGVDQIDVEACSERGIIVANGAAPENFLGMAEATVLAMLAVAKELNRKQRSMREGKWRPEPLRGMMLRGKTIGLVGFGRIARGVAARLQGWETRLLACDPYLPATAIAEAGAEPVDFETLLKQSDIVSLHVVLTPETKNLIGARELAMMKPGAVLVNAARGGLIDEAALADALNRGHLLGAAIDTLAEEPPRFDGPLFAVDPDRILLTGHCIGHGIELHAALVGAAVENLCRVMRGEPPLYPVNPAVLPAWRERVARLDRSFGPPAP